MTTQSIEGAMPPLPKAKWFDTYQGPQEGYTEYQLRTYAAPLLARVAELQAQNEAQKDEWLSWNEKRAGLERDAARYRWLRHGDNDERVLRHYSTSRKNPQPTMYLPRGGDLDGTIDAALAAHKEQP